MSYFISSLKCHIFNFIKFYGLFPRMIFWWSPFLFFSFLLLKTHPSASSIMATNHQGSWIFQSIYVEKNTISSSIQPLAFFYVFYKLFISLNLSFKWRRLKSFYSSFLKVIIICLISGVIFILGGFEGFFLKSPSIPSASNLSLSPNSYSYLFLFSNNFFWRIFYQCDILK